MAERRRRAAQRGAAPCGAHPPAVGRPGDRYQVTAEDPETLAKPYTYTRLFQNPQSISRKSSAKTGNRQPGTRRRAAAAHERRPRFQTMALTQAPDSANSVTRAFTELRELIVRGHLPPGSWIAEAHVAERLGLSRTPVRAALQRLHQEG